MPIDIGVDFVRRIPNINQNKIYLTIQSNVNDNGRIYFMDVDHSWIKTI